MELPERKPTRLKEYDYSQNGYYFITICTRGRKNILSNIVGEGLCALPRVNLTPIGKEVEKSIEHINNYEGVVVDKYVIMPNHIHLIIGIKTGGDETPPLRVFDIIGRLKSYTTNKYGNIMWRRSFHDHIIRGEKDYIEICKYIENNPAKWLEDKFYTEQ